MFYILRPPYIDSLHLVKEATELSSKTTYKFKACIEEAPDFTHCVSSIAYLFKRIGLAFPYTWIGDIARTLLLNYDWKLIKTNLASLKVGDLIFIKRSIPNHVPYEGRFITHVCLSLGEGKIFHSSKERMGGFIETIFPTNALLESLIKKAPNDPNLLFRYIDRRNIADRRVYAGPLVYSHMLREPLLRIEDIAREFNRFLTFHSRHKLALQTDSDKITQEIQAKKSLQVNPVGFSNTLFSLCRLRGHGII